MSLLVNVDLDPGQFEMCLMQDQRSENRIDLDMKEAAKLGISSTPTFAIGRMAGDTTVEVNKIITGAQPFSVFESVISEML